MQSFKKYLDEGEAAAAARERIKREKEADKRKHDRDLDRARTADTQTKNRETSPTTEARKEEDVDETFDPKSRVPAAEKEYKQLKKTSTGELKKIWQRSHKISDARGLSKSNLIFDILRDKFGNKTVDLMNEDLDEAKYDYYTSEDEGHTHHWNEGDEYTTSDDGHKHPVKDKKVLGAGKNNHTHKLMYIKPGDMKEETLDEGMRKLTPGEITVQLQRFGFTKRNLPVLAQKMKHKFNGKPLVVKNDDMFVKEEVEDLDELSTKKLQQFNRAAGADDQMGKNREKGVTLALNKIRARNLKKGPKKDKDKFLGPKGSVGSRFKPKVAASEDLDEAKLTDAQKKKMVADIAKSSARPQDKKAAIDAIMKRESTVKSFKSFVQ